MLNRRSLLSYIVPLALVCLSVVSAKADMYGFVPITHNSGALADAVAKQLFLEVTQPASNVLFTFLNDGPMLSTITHTYFDDAGAVLNAILTPINGTGVSFSIGGNPANLNGGVGAPYHFTADFRAAANNPAGLNKNGVDIGQNVQIPFTLRSAKTLSDVIALLNAGATDPFDTTNTLRVGIHVQAIGGVGGTSDAFLLTPPAPVPAPAAAILGMLGFGTVGWRLRRFA